MYKTAHKFGTSPHIPERHVHPKDEFVHALIERLVEMSAYQLTVSEIKARATDMRLLNHSLAQSTADVLSGLEKLEPVVFPSKSTIERMGRENIDRILVESYPQYSHYRNVSKHAVSVCTKFIELSKNIEELSKLDKANIKRFDGTELLKEKFTSAIEEAKKTWPGYNFSRIR